MDEFLVVDLEMTGLRPTKDRILEIGAVYLRDGKIAETFSTLVNPQRKLTEHIKELTGITDAMVADAPVTEDALRAYFAFAKDAVLIGHNLIYDYSFLKQAALNLGVSYERSGLDTLKIARKLLPEDQPKSLAALCEYFDIKNDSAHRALDDALATANVFLRLQELGADTLTPKPLVYKAKKQGPLTPAQKRDLQHLIAYHKIDADVAIESLTKSEASRMIDRIYATYGREAKEHKHEFQKEKTQK